MINDDNENTPNTYTEYAESIHNTPSLPRAQEVQHYPLLWTILASMHRKLSGMKCGEATEVWHASQF